MASFFALLQPTQFGPKVVTEEPAADWFPLSWSLRFSPLLHHIPDERAYQSNSPRLVLYLREFSNILSFYLAWVGSFRTRSTNFWPSLYPISVLTMFFFPFLYLVIYVLVPSDFLLVHLSSKLTVCYLYCLMSTHVFPAHLCGPASVLFLDCTLLPLDSKSTCHFGPHQTVTMLISYEPL